LIGYAGAFCTGIILGLLGGGGAIISVPVLVYIFNLSAVEATGYSLFLVGVTASAGAVNNIRKKMVDYTILTVYGIPSFVSVYVVRRWVLPSIPNSIFETERIHIQKDNLILVTLSVVMFLVAGKMLNANKKVSENTVSRNYPKLAFSAVKIGSFLGLVGAGGGFLMTPALMHYGQLDMRKAIGTSLVLVALNSFVGFAGDLHTAQLNWQLLTTFSAFSITGVVIGTYTAQNVNQNLLRKLFAGFMIAVASYILLRQIAGY